MVKASGGAERPRALRRLNTPRQVQVRTGSSGAPSALRTGTHWQEVAGLLDCYRTDDRWWMAEPIARTYYELLLDDGRTVTVFRDDIRDGWYEQRYG